MKKIISLLVVISILGLCLIYNNQIINFLVNTLTDYSKDETTLWNNEYASNENYSYVQLTDKFMPKNKNDIMNIYYTVINSGMDSFTFYCDSEYKDCINDIDYISDNKKLLSDINNFLPVYNSFSDIYTKFNTLGKVTIYVTYNYTNNEIEELKNKVDSIYNELINIDMNNKEKIKAIHDYIINNTKYDIARSDKKITTYRSDTAYGALIEHYAICGGYADSMKLFLDKFNLPNYKISSENHIWNLVKLDNKWYHLDLTWDDPITSNDEDILEYDYFLITTDELKQTKSNQHIFDENIYKEAL